MPSSSALTQESVREIFAEEHRRATEKRPELFAVEFAGFNCRKRCLGVCKQRTTPDGGGRKHAIELSRFIVRLAREDVVDTIRHELAHAAAGIKEGHGRRWQEAATQLGARPHRCAREGMMKEGDFRWYLIVSDSREIVQRYVARPRRSTDLSRTYAKGRKRETLGKLVLVSADEYHRTPTNMNTNTNTRQ